MPNPARRPLLLLPLLPLLPTRAAQAETLKLEPFSLEPLLLEPLMTSLAAIPERRARFNEERHFSALTTTLSSRGRLLYRRPDYLEMDKEWPVTERTVIDGTRLILTNTGDNEPPRVIDFAGQPELGAMFEAMRAPLAGDLTALRRLFDVTCQGRPEAWSITLNPRDPRAAKLLREVQLAGRGTWIGEIRFIQANGDDSRMLIEPI